jgi:uncharacterized protein
MSDHAGVIAAIQAGDVETLRILLEEHPALASARDESGVSVIMHALYRKQRDMVDLFLAAQPALDVFEAASLGQGERLAQLLEQNPQSARLSSVDGFTPLHFACFFSQPQIASLLLQHGVDVNAVAQNATKVTPLHSAAAARNLPIVTLLLTHGASPNVRQYGGWTPLHSAAQHGDKGMVEALLKHGADRAPQSDDGTTPADLARKHGHDQIVNLLG